MSKKKLLEFGLKEADAFQKNFKIIFDRLVRGYKSVMGKDPEGIDLLKVKMEAREKALNSTKVVNQKGLTLDPDKPIVGGTQEGIETITTKSAFDELENFTKRPEDIVEDMVDEKFGKNFFGDELDNLSFDKTMQGAAKESDAMRSAGLNPKNLDDYKKAQEMGIIKGPGDELDELENFKYRSPDTFDNRKEYEKYLDETLGPPDDVFGNPVKDQMLENFDKVKVENVTPKPTTEVFEEALGVRLYGDETFEELMKIKETGVHPRGEPPIKKAEGGRVGLRYGGDTMGGPNDRSAQQSADNRDRGRTEQYSRPSAPQDLGFIGSGPTISPTFKKGPTIVSAPDRDSRFAGYTPSTFDLGNRNIFQKGFDLVKRTATNPFLQNIGLGILGGPIGSKFGLTRQIDMFNKARAIKSLIDNYGPMGDLAVEEDLEGIVGTDVTGKTTALYKDGGLVTLFTEKR